MTKLAPEWVRTSDPVIRSPARYRWTTVPALTPNRKKKMLQNCQRIWTEVMYSAGLSVCYFAIFVILISWYVGQYRLFVRLSVSPPTKLSLSHTMNGMHIA